MTRQAPRTGRRHAALAACLAVSAAAHAEVIEGYWAAEESDCRQNRFVWHFAAGRVALLIDNRPVAGYFAATQSGGATQSQVRFVNAAGRTVEFAIAMRGPGEIDIVGATLDGSPLAVTRHGPWIRCDGAR